MRDIAAITSVENTEQFTNLRMGPKNDTNSVVDPDLRVHGLRNLRVADASIMPRITTGNINTPIMMIGEKAADMIKRDHGLI